MTAKAIAVTGIDKILMPNRITFASFDSREVKMANAVSAPNCDNSHVDFKRPGIGKKEFDFTDMQLRFWGGKDTVMGGGLFAEIFMCSSEYNNMRAERRKKKDAKREGLTTAEAVTPVQEDGVDPVAATQGTNNDQADAAEVAETDIQHDDSAENEVNVPNEGCDGEDQPKKPASPGPSQAPSVRSDHANEEAQLPEATKSLAAPNTPSSRSSTVSNHSPKEESAEKPLTSPAASKAPSTKATSSISVTLPAPNVPGGLALGDKEESTLSGKDGAPGEQAVPRLRGGGPPSKEHTSTSASKKNRVSAARLSVPDSSSKTTSQSKEASQQRPSSSSQHPSQPPTQTRQSTKHPTSSTILSAPPTIPQLNISRDHSVRPESSASWQVSADPATPAGPKSLGRNWEKARHQPGDPATSSITSVKTTSQNIWKWDDGRSRKQPAQAVPNPDTAPLRCMRCGALCHCAQDRANAQSKAPSEKASASHSHAASQALHQKPAASRVPSQQPCASRTRTTSQKQAASHIHPSNVPSQHNSRSYPQAQAQSPTTKPQSYHSSQSRSQIQAQAQASPFKPQSQHSSRSYHEAIPKLSNSTRDSRIRSIPAPTHAPSKASNQQTAKSSKPVSSNHGTHSQHSSHAKSQPHTASQGHSHTSAIPKSQTSRHGQTAPNPATPIAVPRPVAPQVAAVLPMRSTPQAQQTQPQAQVQPQQRAAVVSTPRSAPPAQHHQPLTRPNNSAPVASSQQQPRSTGANSIDGNSVVISWGHGPDHPKGTGSIRFSRGGGGDESDDTSSTSSDSDTGGAVIDFSRGGPVEGRGWQWTPF
ncbi:hypothetical protein H2200_000050 [Cladophialophora chaetospira]|uniref:Uncharacterized protein n=1 Tax=Cladophialophora chaetospira TaxID=386627 RepID=A0AA39CPY7_9EURO|nr:hypothetical protein H2200_000050 [Cladophialophora chaetospira]